MQETNDPFGPVAPLRHPASDALIAEDHQAAPAPRMDNALSERQSGKRIPAGSIIHASDREYIVVKQKAMGTLRRVDHTGTPVERLSKGEKKRRKKARTVLNLALAGTARA